MGNHTYDAQTRAVTANLNNYASNSLNDNFTQNKIGAIHESMKPQKIREARDSNVHPNTVPICLFLDVTGSMSNIPQMFIADGLPTLMTTLEDLGVKDAAVLFGGVGDHISDSVPLQAGQFESGNEQLDSWLTKLYLERNGGGNGGESYPVAWQFVDKYTVTDAWEKRKEKGFIFTIGDEKFHDDYDMRGHKKIYESASFQESPTVSAKQLLEQVSERYDVYHLHINHGAYSKSEFAKWKDLLGENAIEVSDYKEIPKIMASTIVNNLKNRPSNNDSASELIKELNGENVKAPVPVKKKLKSSIMDVKITI